MTSRNDTAGFAYELPAVRAGSMVDELNFHEGDESDWYWLNAPTALETFGNASKALLTGDMITAVPLVKTDAGLNETPERLYAYLFPAENIDPSDEVISLVPRERFSGVPDYYLLHVTNQIMPRDQIARGRALNFSGEDYVRVGDYSSLKLTTQATLEAWLYPTATSKTGIILNKEGEYKLARFADGKIGYAFGSSTDWNNTNYEAPLNQWTQITVTFNLGEVCLYANGELISKSPSKMMR